MSAIADIIVKKADNTTSLTFSAIAGSGGDTSPAVWRSNSAGGTPGQQPTMSVKTQWNGPKTVRRLQVDAVFPQVYTDANTGLTQVRDRATLSATFQCPTVMTVAYLQEFAAQITNLMASQLIKDSISAGYAPT